MISFIISVLSLFSIGQSTYLRNEKPDIQYLDIKTGGAISVNHQYPYVGFGCSKKYKNPSAQVKELFTKAKKCALMSGLKGYKIREKVRCDEETVNNFKKLVEDPNNDYALDNMSELIVALRNAKFVTSKSFDIDNEDAERFTIDEGSVLTGMVYEVNFLIFR